MQNNHFSRKETNKHHISIYIYYIFTNKIHTVGKFYTTTHPKKNIISIILHK